MKALVDIPDEMVQDLECIRAQQGISRVELVRRAIAEYVRSHATPDEDAFGIFKSAKTNAVDGLDYQESMRSEW